MWSAIGWVKERNKIQFQDKPQSPHFAGGALGSFFFLFIYFSLFADAILNPIFTGIYIYINIYLHFSRQGCLSGWCKRGVTGGRRVKRLVPTSWWIAGRFHLGGEDERIIRTPSSCMTHFDVCHLQDGALNFSVFCFDFPSGTVWDTRVV